MEYRSVVMDLKGEELIAKVREKMSTVADELKSIAYGIKDPIAMVVIVCSLDKESDGVKVDKHIGGDVEVLQWVIYSTIHEFMSE